MPKKTSRSARPLQAQGVRAEPKNVVGPLESTGPAGAVQMSTGNFDAAENRTVTARPTVTRRPYARRTTATVDRKPTQSREEEYAFIRSDLVTVAILTVLMVAVLIGLTFLIA